MKIKKILILSVIWLFVNKSFGQNDLSFLGIWKGTSICQVKNSPCHNENVVYHISKMENINLFKIAMNKIVNNKVEEMGAMDFVYDSRHKTLTSFDSSRNAR